MKPEERLELLAQGKFHAYLDYTETGEDKPTWEEWLSQMQVILVKRPKRTMLSYSIALIDQRAF